LALGIAKRPKADPRKPSEQVDGFTSAFVDGVLTEASQAFSSETQALDFLVSSITDKLGAEGGERSQMLEFLNLILETDPALKRGDSGWNIHEKVILNRALGNLTVHGD